MDIRDALRGIDYSVKNHLFDIECYKRECKDLIEEYGFKDKKNITELGTYIAGNAGYYMAEMIDIKLVKVKKHIIIAGRVNHLGFPFEMRRKLIRKQ